MVTVAYRRDRAKLMKKGSAANAAAGEELTAKPGEMPAAVGAQVSTSSRR
jgi:hypothetical protein